jgi:hypothetical protein
VTENTSISILTNGDVGIGTDPLANLHIGGTGAFILPKDTVPTGLTGMLRFNDDTKTLEFYSGTGWFALATSGSISSGGVVSENDGFRIHTFKSSGTFSIQESREVEYLVVAGGGGGRGRHGGGGGAGGLLTGTTTLSPDNYDVIVGAGGAGSAAGSVPGAVNTPNPAFNGSNSSFSTLFVAEGGGNGSGADGGSGGGGVSGQAGGNGVVGQGKNGGNGTTNSIQQPSFAGGGGGGAGTAGGNAVNGTQATGGNGGVGEEVFGTVYAGGGGGGAAINGISAGTGGQGGGGDGGSSGAGQDGTPNTGGGGGGGGFNGTNNFASGNGGSGIVIIRYQI